MWLCSILWKKNEVADYEATTFSIFYNNALFLTIVILSSFYLLRSFSPLVYPFTENNMHIVLELLGEGRKLFTIDYTGIVGIFLNFNFSETTFCPLDVQVVS